MTFASRLDGVLKSWAVPKGPSLDPDKKALAVHVEDHPLEYGTFEGTIPEGEYGGGTVMLWDRGTWEPEGDAVADYRRGKLVFTLHGERLKGGWALIRMGGKAGQNGKNWLLKKLDDAEARSGTDDDVVDTMTTSVATGRTMEEIAGPAPRFAFAANTRAKSPKTSASKPKASAKSVAKPARTGKTAANPGAMNKKKSNPTDKPDRRVRQPMTANADDLSMLDGARKAPIPAVIIPDSPPWWKWCRKERAGSMS